MRDVQSVSPQAVRPQRVRLSPEIREFVSVLSALETQAQDKDAEGAKLR